MACIPWKNAAKPASGWVKPFDPTKPSKPSRTRRRRRKCSPCTGRSIRSERAPLSREVAGRAPDPTDLNLGEAGTEGSGLGGPRTQARGASHPVYGLRSHERRRHGSGKLGLRTSGVEVAGDPTKVDQRNHSRDDLMQNSWKPRKQRSFGQAQSWL